MESKREALYRKEREGGVDEKEGGRNRGRRWKGVMVGRLKEGNKRRGRKRRM